MEDISKINRIMVNWRDSSSSQYVFAPATGSVLPGTSDGQFRFLIPEFIYKNLDVSAALKINILDDFFGNGVFNAVVAGDNILQVSSSDVNITAPIYNIKFILYYSSCDATVAIPNNWDALPFITDASGKNIPSVNPVIGINPVYSGAWQDFYIYVIAEAPVDGIYQLFLYSMRIRHKGECLRDPVTQGKVSSNVFRFFKFSSSSSSSSSGNIEVGAESFGWQQLTYDGENRNASICVDRSNNLHIFWESDLAGITQVYYGMLGPGQRRMNAVLSSVADRQYEFDRLNKSKLSNYLSENLYNIKDPEALDLTRNGNFWLANTTNSGSVVVNSNVSVDISGNPVKDQFLACSVLDKDGDGNSLQRPDQLSYQVSFDLVDNIPIEPLSDSDIDKSFSLWKSQFSLMQGEDTKNLSFYKKDKNKYIVGIIRDASNAFIPIVGSYNSTDTTGHLDGGINAISQELKAVFGKDNSNVKNFILGLIPEKSLFRAKNVQNITSFTEENSLTTDEANAEYVEKIETTIFTGKYRLGLFLKTDNDFLNKDTKISRYILNREYDKSFSLDGFKNIKIAVHYAKIFAEESLAFATGDSDIDISFKEIADVTVDSGEYFSSISKIGDRIGIAYIPFNDDASLRYAEMEPNTRVINYTGIVETSISDDFIQLIEYNERPAIACVINDPYMGLIYAFVFYNGAAWEREVIGSAPSVFDGNIFRIIIRDNEPFIVYKDSVDTTVTHFAVRDSALGWKQKETIQGNDISILDFKFTKNKPVVAGISNANNNILNFSYETSSGLWTKDLNVNVGARPSDVKLLITNDNYRYAAISQSHTVKIHRYTGSSDFSLTDNIKTIGSCLTYLQMIGIDGSPMVFFHENNSDKLINFTYLTQYLWDGKVIEAGVFTDETTSKVNGRIDACLAFGKTYILYTTSASSVDNQSDHILSIRELATTSSEAYFSGDIIIALDNEVVMSQGFTSRLTNYDEKFVIGFGSPAGGKLTVNESHGYLKDNFEDKECSFSCRNIAIGSHKIGNASYAVLGSNTRDTSKMIIPSSYTDESAPPFSVSDDGFSNWRLTYHLDFGNSLCKIPLTFVGENINPNTFIDNSDSCHLVWQSNRNMFWNIFYNNDNVIYNPFRFETTITDTESNSLKPVITVGDDFTRMIAWHDNRYGNYQILSAKGGSADNDGIPFNKRNLRNGSFETFNIAQDLLVEPYGIYAFCPLGFTAINNNAEQKTFNFILKIFDDAATSNLLFTVLSADNPDAFMVNGLSISSSGYTSLAGESFAVTISHLNLPIPYVDILNKLYYIKLELACA